jgi:hypothetical protein
LTDADHFSMMRTAQRRFAPMVIAIFRIGGRHQFGICESASPESASMSLFCYNGVY